MSNPWRQHERRAFACIRRGQRELEGGDERRADACLAAAAEHLICAAQAAPQAAAPSLLDQADGVMDLLGGHRARASSGPWQVVADTGVRLDDVAGLDEAKRLAYTMLVRPLLDPEGARRWRQRVGGGILLYGPPGTGKTLFARAIAGELEAAFLNVAGGSVLSKWFGEAERNVAALFDEAARHDRCVLFIDEVDAMLPARGQSQPHMSRVVSAFLAAMDGIAGRQEGLLLLGATNRPDEIDPAALRHNRFERQVHIGLPDPQARRAILGRRLDGIPVAPGVRLTRLAAQLDGYSGADIESFCDQATSHAWDREEARGRQALLAGQDIACAFQRIKPSVIPAELERYEEFRRRHSASSTPSPPGRGRG